MVRFSNLFRGYTNVTLGTEGVKRVKGNKAKIIIELLGINWSRKFVQRCYDKKGSSEKFWAVPTGNNLWPSQVKFLVYS